MNKLLLRACGPFALLTGMLVLTSPVLGQTDVNSFAPFSNPPDLGVWYEADVRPGGTAAVVDLTGLGGNLETNAPLGIGAAALVTDLTNAAKAEVAVPDDFGTVDSILNSLVVGFDWYEEANPDPSANVFAAPSITLTFYNPVCDDPASGGDCFMTLVWEAYQDRHAPVPPTSVWITEDFDADSGGWWSTGGFGVPNGFGGCGAVPCPTVRSWYFSYSSDFADA